MQTIPRGIAVMGSTTAGSTRWWAAAVAAGQVVVDSAERRLPLRHSHHRYDIVGPNGPQRLTVPLVADTHTMDTPMADLLISEHAHWRRVHWGAIYSAYGRTPYFEHLAPDLEPVIAGGQSRLLELNTAIARLMIDFMDLPVDLRVEPVGDSLPPGAIDLRQLVGLKRADTLSVADVPYYQLWSGRHGFLPALSILDLAMNHGREAIFVLRKMAGDWDWD